MDFLRSFALAFSCFSVVPMPQVEWNARNMRFMMACFPLVGLVSGLLVGFWCWGAGMLGVGPVLYAVGLALIPLAVSGGIHLDGFADVVDALASHASPARRREILKDPHVGAFACIGVGAYLLLYAGVAGEIPSTWQAAVLVGCVQALVRCESGLASVLLAGGDTGMLSAFRASADKRASMALLLLEYAVVAGVALVVSPGVAIVVLLCGLACLLALPVFARRVFGGMSGDVAGFFLQVTELVMTAALALALAL